MSQQMHFGACILKTRFSRTYCSAPTTVLFQQRRRIMTHFRSLCHQLSRQSFRAPETGWCTTIFCVIGVHVLGCKTVPFDRAGVADGTWTGRTVLVTLVEPGGKPHNAA